MIEQMLTEQGNEQKITVFLLLINPTITKKNDHYIYYVSQGFEYSAKIFKTVTEKYHHLPENEEFYFAELDISKALMRYLNENMSSEDHKTIKSWISQYSMFILKLTNSKDGNEVKLMDNHDSLNYYLILSWFEKQTRISLVKFSKQENSINNISMSLVNTMLVVTILGLLTVGVRNENFHMKQMATIPMFLFTSGHVYNHIHGNSPGDNTWLGVSFSRHYNGQALSESYFVFIIYVALAFAFFELTESQKAVNRTENARLRRQNSARRVNPKKKKTSESAATKRQMIAFVSTVASLAFLYNCSKLKY